jgi:polysaccharide deacetylase family protein (PEP-CTERM system associated)
VDDATVRPSSTKVILSFDIEEHDRIEAAAGLTVAPAVKAYYHRRLEISTGWLLEQLAAHDIRATFFVVGQVARDNPVLVRAIHRAGHEVASHSWDHRRILYHTPVSFRQDVLRSKDMLEQVTGQAVLGYRAPTFSVVRETAWALDVLAELGLAYDSSIYPVRHDRYGVPAAPRGPFVAWGQRHPILELPPATLRFCGLNIPAGGGGYFRLFPLFVMREAIRQLGRTYTPPVVMLYFHPWEFDSEQRRLPLSHLRCFRTYVGTKVSCARLTALLGEYRFARAFDVLKRLDGGLGALPTFRLGA